MSGGRKFHPRPDPFAWKAICSHVEAMSSVGPYTHWQLPLGCQAKSTLTREIRDQCCDEGPRRFRAELNDILEQVTMAHTVGPADRRTMILSLPGASGLAANAFGQVEHLIRGLGVVAAQLRDGTQCANQIECDIVGNQHVHVLLEH